MASGSGSARGNERSGTSRRRREPLSAGLEDGADDFHPGIEHAGSVAHSRAGDLKIQDGIADDSVDAPEPTPGVHDKRGDILGAREMELEGLDLEPFLLVQLGGRDIAQHAQEIAQIVGEKERYR